MTGADLEACGEGRTMAVFDSQQLASASARLKLTRTRTRYRSVTSCSWLGYRLDKQPQPSCAACLQLKLILLLPTAQTRAKAGSATHSAHAKMTVLIGVRMGWPSRRAAKVLATD